LSMVLQSLFLWSPSTNSSVISTSPFLPRFRLRGGVLAIATVVLDLDTSYGVVHQRDWSTTVTIRLIECFLFYLLYFLPFVSLFNSYHVYATDGAVPSILTRNRGQAEVIVLTIWRGLTRQMS
jgi:hypothetical protein